MAYTHARGRLESTIRGLVFFPLRGWAIVHLLRPIFHAVPGLHPHGLGGSHVVPPERAIAGDVRMIIESLIAASLLLLTERGGWSFRRLIERSNLPRTASGFRQGVLGATAGLGAGLIVMAILAAAGCVRIVRDPVSGAAILHGMLIWAGAFLLVGIAEELTNRGYALRALTEGLGFWAAALLTSAWFGYLHLQEGDPWFGALNTGIFGLFMACTWRATGSLGFAIGYHAAWDYTQSLIFGVPDSSFTEAGALLSTHVTGPVWLSGGSVGPEGSVISYLELFILIAIAVRIGDRRRAPRGITASPSRACP